MGANPTPPPPDGLLWSLIGDVRMVLALPAALTLQVAHPAIGAAVDQHSVFRTDPWGRLARSLHSLQLWVYGGELAVAEGHRLRRLHATIQGTDDHGRPYRALDPELYTWVHATGFPTLRYAQRCFGRPFSAAEERRLYAEWLCVGRVLGIRDADMPQTVEEFWPYYEKVLAERVEATTVVRELVDVRRAVPAPDCGPRPVRWLVRTVWPVLMPLTNRFHRFVTVGLMPPEARDAIGLVWTPRQERRLRRFGRVVRAVVPLLPERLRYLPLARAARATRRRAGRARA